MLTEGYGITYRWIVDKHILRYIILVDAKLSKYYEHIHEIVKRLSISNAF